MMLLCQSPVEACHDCDSATEWRHDVAMGASPWESGSKLSLSPSGATRNRAPRIHVAPLGLGHAGNANHGLAPVATACRPVGTESQVEEFQCH